MFLARYILERFIVLLEVSPQWSRGNATKLRYSTIAIQFRLHPIDIHLYNHILQGY